MRDPVEREQAVRDNRPRRLAVDTREKPDAAHEKTVMADADR